ncbi:hypothetical protein [Streptomyces gardneri]|uniref:hypothetical protein n=1 Tax=Streptomyces gardneri TaxID=66892 RepID=UPI0037D8FAAA
MGRIPPRRRRAKPPSGRFASSERTGRNKTFRYANRFGKHAILAFLGVLFVGYLLIFDGSVQITVPKETGYAFAAALPGALVYLRRNRRYRR